MFALTSLYINQKQHNYIMNSLVIFQLMWELNDKNKCHLRHVHVQCSKKFQIKAYNCNNQHL